jgi:hypothetical protein
MWLLADNTTSALFIAGAILIALVLLRRTSKSLAGDRSRKRFARSAQPGPAEPARAAHNLDAPSSLARWEVEMHELARDLSAQLDSKMRVLQELLRASEEERARLEAALHRASAVAGNGDLRGVEREAADRERPQAGIGNSDGEALRYGPIYALADEGYSCAAISEQTGHPIGEVELILSLRGSNERSLN